MTGSALPMVAKQASVYFAAIDEKMSNVKLGCQIQRVTLQRGIFNDIQFREIGLTWRVKSGSATETSMNSEDAEKIINKLQF